VKPKDLLALILLGVLWGGSFLFIRVAAPVLGPLVLIKLRVSLAATVLALYAVVVARHALRSGSVPFRMASGLPSNGDTDELQTVSVVPRKEHGPK
jgi:drug/metabolite transporter (DMT)-like permease